MLQPMEWALARLGKPPPMVLVSAWPEIALAPAVALLAVTPLNPLARKSL
jgi:hypothetical protein